MQLVVLDVKLQFSRLIVTNPATPPWVVPVRFFKLFAGEPLELLAEVDLSLRTSLRPHHCYFTKMVLMDIGDLIDLEIGAPFDVLMGNSVVGQGIVSGWKERMIEVVSCSEGAEMVGERTAEVGAAATHVRASSSAVIRAFPYGRTE